MKRDICLFLALVVIALLGSLVQAQPISNPDTFVQIATIDVETLDPQFPTATILEVPSAAYDTLFDYRADDFESITPSLATEVPSEANGLITYGEDGKVFITCPIRKGVRFHNGALLTPEDVEYTYERAALVGAIYPTFRMIFKILIGAASFNELVEKIGYDAAFSRLDRAIEVINDSVVFGLSEPLEEAFLNLNTGSISGMQIFNKAWCIEQGCWPGTKETGQQHMNLTVKDDPLFDKMMGTGPFRLVTWRQDEFIEFERFGDYWKGPAKLARVVRKVVGEDTTAFMLLKAGDADFFTRFDVANLSKIEGAPGVTILTDLPTPWLMMMNFNFDITSGSKYIGNGRLSEDGIPTDFFVDLNIRKAFQYSFDWDAFINEVFLGHAVKPYGTVLVGLPTANPDNPQYYLDLHKAAEYFKKAWDGEVWEKGFRVTIPALTGTGHRQKALEILKANVEKVNPKFHIEISALPVAPYLAAMADRSMPISLFGLIPEAPNPWVSLFGRMHSTSGFIVNQGCTKLAEEKYDPLIYELGRCKDAERIEEISHELQRLFYEDSLAILHFQKVMQVAMRDWVQGYYPSVYAFCPYYYTIYKAHEQS